MVEAGATSGTAHAALITGASYGVGAATALALANSGIDVAITATRVENLAATAQALSAAGVKVVPLALDLNEPERIEPVVEEAARALGGLDILVNNAALPMRKAAVDVTHADWDRLMKVNLAGSYFMCTAFARRLIAAGRPGAIVNVASTHGLIGAAERSLYGISKGAVIQMTRMLAIEWAEKGIRVNAVAPGRLDVASPARAATVADPAYLKAMLARIPMHRLTTAEEVAAAIAFLAGPQAASVTGQVVVLDGGLTTA